MSIEDVIKKAIKRAVEEHGGEDVEVEMLDNGGISISGRSPGGKPFGSDHQPHPSAQVMELVDLQKRYGKCPFRVGQFVTPRANTPLHGSGSPHVVLEVLDQPLSLNTVNSSEKRDHSSAVWGARLNMRVGCYMNDEMVCFWVESWQYEEYTGEGLEYATPQYFGEMS